MNKAYVVAYDHRTSGHDDTALREAIMRSPKWWHYVKSIWIVSTAETPSQLWARLASHVGKDDYLIIIEVKSRFYGWLPVKAWEWLKKNVPEG